MKIIKKITFVFITLLLCCILTSHIYGYSEAVVDITKMDITDIQNAIDKGYLTYEKLTNLYLDRIEKYNDSYNAIININENAIELAKNCDKIYIESGRKSMLFGIPIILKDNIDYTELPTTAGTKALSDSYPNNNSKIVQNLVNSGAIILAKSNMSEFAFSSKISYSSYGSVKNAYNLSYTTYGSSGGSATSVAASFCSASIGTDTNSSIRLPASAANLVGLRPTYGLLSNDGIIAYDITRDTAGPITKTVTDNAILLTSLADNGIDYTNYLKKDGLSNKKIGVISDFLKNSYSEVNTLFETATKKMENAGATIITINDFYDSDLEYYNNYTIYGLTMAYQFNQYIKNTSSSIKSFSDLLKNGRFVQDLNSYNSYADTDLTKSEEMDKKNELREKFRETVNKLMEKYELDVLIYPTSSNKLLKLDNTDSSEFYNNSYKIAPTIGYPSITVPLGFDSDNLPYGFEILSKPNQENLLYEVAYSYEQLEKSLITPNNVSPSLYKISENTNKLVSIYSQFVGKNEDIDKLAKSFFSDYENIENKEDKALELINKYNDYFKTTDNSIQTMSNIDNVNGYSFIQTLLNFKDYKIIIIAIITILAINILVRINNKKKRQKRKSRKRKNNYNNIKKRNRYNFKTYPDKRNDLYMKKLLNKNDKFNGYY